MYWFDDLEKYTERVAVICAGGLQKTYGELISGGDSLARRIGGRTLVFLMCSNTVESIKAYIGFLRARIVPVLVDSSIDPQLLSRLEKTYKPEYCYYTDNRASGGTTLFSHSGYTLFRTEYVRDYELFEDLGLLMTTSGSTGSPKLVRQSYQNIDSNTRSIIEYLGIIGSDRAITTLPMHYTYGLSIINTHFASGSTILLNDAAVLQKEFWIMFKKYKATTFGGVPYVYEMLSKLHFDQMQLPSLRYITQAGGHLNAKLTREFLKICADKEIQMIIMYGQTEATARMSYLPWEYATKKIGSIGIAIPNGKFWIEDTDMSPIEQPNVVGELVYEGPNVTLGYAQASEDLALGDERNGVLFTGDMAKRDTDGYYYIVGRKKRFLKIFGSRVNLDEVEELLTIHGISCVCAGKDDHLHVFITNPQDEDLARNFIVHNINIPRSALTFSVISEIPRSSSGKLLYSALPPIDPPRNE